MGRVIPVRFKRVAEAFDHVVARERLCESSGSEHSPDEDTMNLSDLVDSFIEENDTTRGDHTTTRTKSHEVFDDVDKENESDIEEDLKKTLRDLFGYDERMDDFKRRLLLEIGEAYPIIGYVSSSPGFKRSLMACLREKGFNTGLCKSKWEKNGHVPSGSYEYIDIDISGTRYIIEVHLATHFEIARPTDSYSSLLQTFPSIFVGKPEDFKRIVRLMCTAIRHSMKSSEMALPPWRRYAYMCAKWFGSYKRTINVSSVKFVSQDDELAKKRSIGFVPLPTNSYYCRGNFATNVGFRMGKLAIELNGMNMLL